MIHVDDYLSGESTWQCIGSFTGKITNPLLLSAQANVTDAGLGFFTATNIAIGATGATVVVGAGVLIAGAGAGTLTAVGAANANNILQAARGLSEKYAYTGATAESFQQSIINNLPNGTKDVKTALENAQLKDIVLAERQAISEIANLNSDQLADEVLRADPSVMTKMKAEWKLIKADKVPPGMRKFEAGIYKTNKKEYVKKIMGTGVTDGKADEIMTTIELGFLPRSGTYPLLRLRPPMQYRSRAGGGPRYHRIPNNKLNL